MPCPVKTHMTNFEVLQNIIKTVFVVVVEPSYNYFVILGQTESCKVNSLLNIVFSVRCTITGSLRRKFIGGFMRLFVKLLTFQEKRILLY